MISHTDKILTGLVAAIFLIFFLIVRADAAGDGSNLGDPSWQFSIKQKTLFNSHTSYEFGNPGPPYQTPLSRLEFPVDSVWGGFEVRKQLSRFSAGIEFLSSISDQDSGRFKDSDWDDAAINGRLTNYGETACRLLPSYQVVADMDMQVADLVKLPGGFDLRPVTGFRWQQLSLLAHDGTQYDYNTPGLPPNIVPLPGATIAFDQSWYHCFLGMRFGYEWQRLAWLHRLKLKSQLDWSYVYGENMDRHLLRGDRTTEQLTSGDAWHASLGVLLGLARNLDLELEADYLSIQTTGSHTLRDTGYVENWSHGVKVWSEQFGLTFRLGYRF